MIELLTLFGLAGMVSLFGGGEDAAGAVTPADLAILIGETGARP